LRSARKPSARRHSALTSSALPRQIQELRWGGKEAEAIQLAEHYVELAKERYGEDQPDFAAPLLLLAQLYAAQARPADAERLFKNAIAIRETALSADNLLVADAVVQLGYFYQAQSRYPEAEGAFKRALAIREKAFTRCWLPRSSRAVGAPATRAEV
jgi:tetratricopeptide (TPR) repeat protein